jgi:hypothetical protein
MADLLADEPDFSAVRGPQDLHLRARPQPRWPTIRPTSTRSSASFEKGEYVTSPTLVVALVTSDAFRHAPRRSRRDPPAPSSLQENHHHVDAPDAFNSHVAAHARRRRRGCSPCPWLEALRPAGRQGQRRADGRRRCASSPGTCPTRHAHAVLDAHQSSGPNYELPKILAPLVDRQNDDGRPQGRRATSSPASPTCRPSPRARATTRAAPRPS